MRELTYLVVLLACVLGTLPLEFLLQARVYRRWHRAVLAILPVAVIFVLWDWFAARAGWWRFDRSYLTGVFVGPLPLEELLFFLVIPVCGLLTFEAVRHLRPQWVAGSSLGRAGCRHRRASMIDYGYTAASLLAILVAVVVDLLVLHTRILRTRAFWACYAIVVFFQLIVNGILTGFGIVQYDPRVILGIRLAYAPLEDLGFGFGLVTSTLSLWARLESRSRQKRRAGVAAGTATASATSDPAITSIDRTTHP